MYTPVGSNTPKVSSFRLVAATNQDLSKMVLEKKMRSDFITRVHVLSITLPPLRERHGDIPLLVEAYMERKGISCALPLQVRLAMEHYDWPATCASCTIFSTVTRLSGMWSLSHSAMRARRSCFSPPCITRAYP